MGPAQWYKRLSPVPPADIYAAQRLARGGDILYRRFAYLSAPRAPGEANALENVSLEREDLGEHASESRVGDVRPLGEKRREPLAPPLDLRMSKHGG